MKKQYLLILSLVFLIGIGVLSFSKNKSNNTASTIHQEIIQSFKPKGKLRNNIKPFYGNITNIDGNELVVVNQDGSTNNIIISKSTKIEGGTIADLRKKTSVSGVGNLNEDKSITASNIKINPTSFLNSSSPSAVSE